MMTDRLQLPIELLRVALGICPGLSREFSDEEWNDCFDFADKQAVLGVIYHGIELLPSDQKPGDIDLLMEWIGQVEYQRTRNQQLAKACRKMAALYQQNGFDCWILKGQGLSSYYSPQNMTRTPGDVDIWVVPKGDEIPALDKRREMAYKVCRDYVPGYDKEKEGDLHTSFDIRDITVEVHCTPCILCSQKRDKRMQEWFTASLPAISRREGAANARTKGSYRGSNTADLHSGSLPTGEGGGRGPFPTPSLEFNLVYLMLHMYGHYLFEGIGLRHVVDYYLVLKESTAEQRKEAMETLKSLGVDKFAGAMMWVIEELTASPSARTYSDVLNTGLRREVTANACMLVKGSRIVHVHSGSLSTGEGGGRGRILICEPDSWRGRMLMEAIIEGGNFGKANKMNSKEYRQWGVKRIWRFVSRMSRLLIAYPEEIGWHVLGKFKIQNS